MLTVVLLVFFLVAITRVLLQNRKDFLLWLNVFAFYFIYMLATNYYVTNPTRDFFVSVDQITFYTESLDLSKQSFGDIVDSTFGHTYNQSPLIFFIFAYIIKFSNILGICNYLLILKLSVVYLGTLIFPLLAKIVRSFGGHDDNGLLLSFAFLSPILCYSVQLLRDIHVCLLFTLMFYVSVKPKCKLRWLWLIIMIILSYYLRIENGLFALLFLCLSLLRFVEYRINLIIKIGLFLVVSVGIFVLYGYVQTIMYETFNNYNQRGIEMASSDSLGVKLSLLPFPLNYLGKTMFGQILPFPCWFPLLEGKPYTYLRAIECFFPFFWVPVLISSVYAIVKKTLSIPRFVKFCIVFCLVYIFMTSAGSFDTRRVMASYPALFSCFLYVNQKCDLKRTLFTRWCSMGLFALYLIYIIIKG